MNNLADCSVPINEYRLYVPPQPNAKMSFGGATGPAILWYSVKIPNRFQRWMILKVFGVRIERLEEKNTC